MKIQINDCTIRDGGYLLDKNSPKDFVMGIAEGLFLAGIDIIEIGFLQNITNNESIVYENSVGSRKYIPKGADASRFTGFCDNSRYSLDRLDNNDGKSFDYLRISFAKHEINEAVDFIAGAKVKGYKVFANPMDATSYSSDEIIEVINKINKIQPYAFSIVDTFGTMHLSDLQNIFNLVNSQLDKTIRMGLHSHNNLQLSNALAEVMIDLAFEADRDIVVDGSLYGMGRGAGNASTEVLASYINGKYGKQYDIGILFDTIERFILPYNNTVKWGYDLPMFVCGIKGSHVDNIFHLQKNTQLSSNDIMRVISNLDYSHRKRYGTNYSKTDFTELEKSYNNFMKKGKNL